MNYNSITKKYTKIKNINIVLRAFYAKLLYKLGVSVKEIAFRFELSESRIYQYLKK
jgi:transposase